MDARCEIHSDLKIPPGEFLEEVIESLGMSVGKFTESLGLPTADACRVLDGKGAITEALAGALELWVCRRTSGLG